VRGSPECRIGLGFATELVQDEGAVHQRLDVVRVQRQRAVQLRQRRVLLAHQRVRQPEQVMRIGKRPARRDHLF